MPVFSLQQVAALLALHLSYVVVPKLRLAKRLLRGLKWWQVPDVRDVLKMKRPGKGSSAREFAATLPLAVRSMIKERSIDVDTQIFRATQADAAIAEKWFVDDVAVLESMLNAAVAVLAAFVAVAAVPASSSSWICDIVLLALAFLTFVAIKPLLALALAGGGTAESRIPWIVGAASLLVALPLLTTLPAGALDHGDAMAAATETAQWWSDVQVALNRTAAAAAAVGSGGGGASAANAAADAVSGRPLWIAVQLATAAVAALITAVLVLPSFRYARVYYRIATKAATAESEDERPALIVPSCCSSAVLATSYVSSGLLMTAWIPALTSSLLVDEAKVRPFGHGCAELTSRALLTRGLLLLLLLLLILILPPLPHPPQLITLPQWRIARIAATLVWCVLHVGILRRLLQGFTSLSTTENAVNHVAKSAAWCYEEHAKRTSKSKPLRLPRPHSDLSVHLRAGRAAQHLLAPPLLVVSLILAHARFAMLSVEHDANSAAASQLLGNDDAWSTALFRSMLPSVAEGARRHHLCIIRLYSLYFRFSPRSTLHSHTHARGYSTHACMTGTNVTALEHAILSIPAAITRGNLVQPAISFLCSWTLASIFVLTSIALVYWRSHQLGGMLYAARRMDETKAGDSSSAAAAAARKSGGKKKKGKKKKGKKAQLYSSTSSK